MRALAWLALIVGCAGDVEPVDTDPQGPVCDGRQNPGEDDVDSPFDLDGDGFFDASNPDCAAFWTVNQLDCDDSDPDVNPTAFEIPCNGKDDDCNPVTFDDRDQDGDGVGACTDCDDQNPGAFPGGTEVCFDGFDNDCDGITDNDCGENYNGTWDVTPVSFFCGILGTPLVSMDFDAVFITWNPPFMAMSPTSGGAPSLLEGTVQADGTFSLSMTAGGDCVENYTLEGTFTSATAMEGALVMDLDSAIPGLGLCLTCPVAPQSFPIEATKR